MPRAHPDIARLFEHDLEAWTILKIKGWTCCDFVLRKSSPDYEPSEIEWQAVQYLCDEWDWAYEE